MSFLNEKAVFSAAFALFQADRTEPLPRTGLKRDPGQSFELFEAEFLQRFRNFNKSEGFITFLITLRSDEGCFKPVLQAFYSTACQLWGSGHELSSSSRKALKSQQKLLSKRKQSLSSQYFIK